MAKSIKQSGKKDKKAKEAKHEKNKVVTDKVNPSLQDPEVIKSLNLDDDQWQCTVVLIIVSNHSLSDKLMTELSGIPDVTIITEQNVSRPARKESKSKPGSRARSKSLGSAKSNKSKKTNKTNKTSKKTRSGSKSPKPSQVEEQPYTKTCVSLKKYIIDVKEMDVKENNEKKRIDELGKSQNLKDNIQANVEIEGQNSDENKVNEDSAAFHRFITLWGFYDPKIPEELGKFMIPLRAIVHVTESDNPPKRSADTNNIKVDGKRKQPEEKKIKPVSNKINSEYVNFVDEMSKNINNQDYLEVNKDCIFFNLTANNIKHNTNFKLSVQKLFQNIREAWLSYERYKMTMKTQQIPLINEILKPESAELYNTLVSLVPLECVNIPVIIHCMIEQVAWWVEDDVPSDVSQPASSHQAGKSENTSQESILRHLITKNLTPVIANERDEIKLNTFHLRLPEFDFEEISTKMYLRSPIYKLWEIYPACIHSKTTWFEFHLQKLKDCNNMCYFNHNKFYLHHLHQVLMSTLILNLNYITQSQYNDDQERQLEERISNEFEFSVNKTPVHDKHSTIFITVLLNGMLDKISQRRSILTRNYSQADFKTEVLSTKSIDSTCRDESTKPKWYEKNKTEIAAAETLLQNKAQYKEDKLNRLKAFLLCNEFVGLYEGILNLENEAALNYCLGNYQYIEELDFKILSQTLQRAFQTFSNVNYEYFPPTDTLLLWFNNVSGNKLTSTENINASLETNLGFRDFYTLKLNGKTNLVELSNLNYEANISENEQEALDYSPYVIKKNYNPQSTTVYELDTSRSMVYETVVQFDFTDSSTVSIKKWYYFDKSKCCFNVILTKNNTTMSYEVNPDIDLNYASIRMTFCNGIFANCSFNCRPSISKYEKTEESHLGDNVDNVDYELVSNLAVTLPSGLFIEIVPIDGELGPFYIKQKYLSKGPACSKIWDEAYRCYLKNGTIMIFRNDSSVEILYSNGTTVTCTAFEEIEEPIENPEKPKASKETLKNPQNESSTKKTKAESSKNTQKKNKKQSLIKDKKQKNIKTQIGEQLINDENISLSEKVKALIHTLRIKEHSVLCPKGENVTFVNHQPIKKENIQSLRIGFDNLNHELHLRRSDGQRCVFTPELLTVTFKDGSKITSYTEDEKELMIDGFGVISTEDRNSKTSKSKGSTDEHEVNFTPGQDESKYPFEHLKSEDDEHVEHFVMVVSSYNLEHNNYATVIFKNNEDLTEICLPGEIQIRIDKNRLFTITTEDGDTIWLDEENSLHFQANVLLNSLKQSKSVIQLVNFNNCPRIISQTEDSYDNKLSIDDRGNANLLQSETGCDKFEPAGGPPHYQQNSHRFFVFQRDLTGYEIMHNNQTMSNYFTTHKTDKDIIKIPIIKDNPELFTLCTQKSIYKNKSESYLMSYVNEQNLPFIIKEKKLKRENTPEIIWFDRACTLIAPVHSASLREAVIKPKAMVITQKTKIIMRDYDLLSTFSMLLKNYMNRGEDLYKKYEKHYSVVIRKEDIAAEGERLRKVLFGSKSYRLVDNLPTVMTGDGTYQHYSPEITINEILSSYEITS